MYNPTKWQSFKDVLRALFCRHRNTEISTVEGGNEDEEMKVIAKFKYCKDCKNSFQV